MCFDQMDTRRDGEKEQQGQTHKRGLSVDMLSQD